MKKERECPKIVQYVHLFGFDRIFVEKFTENLYFSPRRIVYMQKK